MAAFSFPLLHLWGVGYPDCFSHALSKHCRGGISPPPQQNPVSSSNINYPMINTTPVSCLVAEAKRCSKVTITYIILMLNYLKLLIQ